MAIESVQRAATRYILDFPTMSYKNRLRELNLLPLSYRRDIADVNFIFRCMHIMYNININEFVKYTSNNIVFTRSSNDDTKLCIPHCKTTTFSQSYFNRIVHTWNSIPIY